jgi:hypothetical protein
MGCFWRRHVEDVRRRKLVDKNVDVTILESSPNLGVLASAWSIGRKLPRVFTSIRAFLERTI